MLKLLTERRLNAYLLAGGAMLAASPVAQGAIIYSGPQNIVINPNQSQTFDFNNDGQNDFTFSTSLTGTEAAASVVGLASAYASSQITEPGKNEQPRVVGRVPDRLLQSILVDGNLDYTTQSGILAGSDKSGNFTPGMGQFLGLRFAGPRYGWVQVGASVNQPSDDTVGDATLTIYDWAYQSTPDTGIPTGDNGSAVPEPGTMALMAAGFTSFALLRRRK